MDKNDRTWLDGYNTGVSEKIEHLKPSKETRDWLEKHDICLARIELALFGDGKNNKGIVVMTREMHDTFKSTRFTGKVVLGFFASVGIISGGIFAMIKLIKSMAT